MMGLLTLAFTVGRSDWATAVGEPLLLVPLGLFSWTSQIPEKILYSAPAERDEQAEDGGKRFSFTV